MNTPQNTPTSEVEFNLDDYTDKSIARLTCMICALPYKDRLSIEEQAILERRDFEEIVEPFNGSITVQNIKEHLQKCIVERNVHLPIGQLLQNLVGEVEPFTQMLQSYRVKVQTEFDADSIVAFTGLFNELRKTTQALMKLNSPVQQATDIQRLILAPLIVAIMQSLTIELDNFRNKLLPIVNSSSKLQADTAIKDILMSSATQLKQRMELSVLRLCEYLGVKKEELI